MSAYPDEALATVDVPIVDEPIDWNAIYAVYDIPNDNSYYYGGSYFYDPVNTEPTSEVISQIGQADDVSTTIKPTTNSSYSVQGATAQEAWDNAKSIAITRTIGPRPYTKGVGKIGQTVAQFNPRPSYTFNPPTAIAGGSYKVEVSVNSLNLTLTKDVLMPKWEGYDTASQEEKNKWDAMYNKMRDHETGHENIFENNMPKVANAFDAEIPFTISFFVSDTREIKNVANTKINEYLSATFNQVLSEVQAESDQYDIDTNNGDN